MVTFPAAKFSSAEELMAALDWWREAGLDHDFLEEAQDWLHRDEPEAAPAVASEAEAPRPAAAFNPVPPPPPAAPRMRIGGDPALWPQDLAAFRDWWIGEPSLDEGQIMGRVPARGSVGAPLMVMVDHPEAEDRDELLSGPRGLLLGRILAALGLGPDQAYVASLLPRHMPLPDWAALQAAGLGELALHHIALAAPQRVISFGSHVSSLLGHAPTDSPLPLPQAYSLGAGIPALAAPGLETLLARPRGKAGLWQALLDWQPA